jgi:DNA primase
VSLGSPLDAKALIKQAIDIVDLVGRFIPLRRQGRQFVGLCPWHEDTRPSLQVDPERQSFKCWVCDIGGDAFSFVMKMEGVGFREALQMLADQTGIALKPAAGHPSGGGQAGTGDKRSLYQAMAWAEGEYHQCLLHSPEAEPARNYLSRRGITPASVEKFRLGYCPERGGWLLAQARDTRFEARILETIGILARSTAGSGVYDRFRGRLLFSIRDPQGRSVGLGGRLLPESGITSPAKYINSPETPLFLKHRMLYGLDVAQKAIRKSGALVMEGYTDCIVAHQHGFENAVAVLGTALGESHLRTLRPFSERIVLVLDGDEAGQRRTNEVLGLFVAEKIDLRILTLPDGLDPCDFLRQQGGEAFARLLADGTVDALEHAFRVYTRGIDLARDVHAASEALERLVGIVARAPRLRTDTTREDRFREEKILQRLAASFRMPEKEIRRRLTELRRDAQRRSAAQPARSDSSPHGAAEAGTHPAPANPWERALLEVLLRHPECIPRAASQISSERFASEPCRRIYQACCRRTAPAGDPGEAVLVEELMLEFEDPRLQMLLVELDESATAKTITDPQTLLEELIERIREIEIDRQLPELTGTLRRTGLDEEEKLNLVAKLVQLQRDQPRHGVSQSTDGQDHDRADRGP